MTTAFQITHDPDVDTVYLRIRESPVAKTIELREFVFADLNAQGEPIGIEFVTSDDFFGFMRDFHGTIDLPESIFANADPSSR
jgi:uncharacterized protein YuzE